MASTVELTAKITPKNEGFTGMVDADQVLGGGGSGTLPDACIALKNRTITKHLEEQPPTADLVVGLGYFKYASTITHVKHETKADTVTWNLEIREASRFAAGTDVFAADETSTTTRQTETGFAEDAIPADSYLVYVATSLTGTPLKLSIAVVATID